MGKNLRSDVNMTIQHDILGDSLDIVVSSDLILPDLRILLTCILVKEQMVSRMIRLDLRQARINAELSETKRFVDYLGATWIPHLEAQQGRLIVCAPESPFENGVASVTRKLSQLSRLFESVKIATTFSDVQIEPKREILSKPSSTLMNRISQLSESDFQTQNVCGLPIVTEESAVA